MQHIVIKHNTLGTIRCIRDHDGIVKVLGVPYGIIPQRFGRSILAHRLDNLHDGRYDTDSGVFDATRSGASSIQPWGSVKSDASNIPIPTDDLPDDEEQSEDCLNLSIYLPSACFNGDAQLLADAKLPVLIFIHGGAFFLGSANRPYYNPINLVRHAQNRHTPIVFVAINYRLGSLGFWNSYKALGLAPANNGIFDQELAFEWLRTNIGNFGGDADNVTVIGQSAGGESVSVQTMRKPHFKRAIMFSGTPVTMPAMTPIEHHDNFLANAEKLGIGVKNVDGKEREAECIVRELIEIDVAKIRELAWVGLPCTHSCFLPVEKPSMRLMKAGQLALPSWKSWEKPVEAQIVSTTTYDGGISYNMMSRDENRKNHARSFRLIAQEVLGAGNGEQLCQIYGIESNNNDPDALQRICLFESDIGFFAAAMSIAENGLVDNTYFQVFDLPNPFHGPILKHGAFATHTFDIVTLLGGIHEDKLPKHYAPVILHWRNTILDFVVNGSPPCARYLSKEDPQRRALLIDEQGVREVGSQNFLGNDQGRRSHLFALADRIAGEAGLDVLWVDVCRRFLTSGE